jgi:hypothetical protein
MARSWASGSPLRDVKLGVFEQSVRLFNDPVHNERKEQGKPLLGDLPLICLLALNSVDF